MTYYVWNGVEGVLDMDGEDDLPFVRTRKEARSAFAQLVRERPDRDWTLWERNGMDARLLRVYARPNPNGDC